MDRECGEFTSMGWYAHHKCEILLPFKAFPDIIALLFTTSMCNRGYPAHQHQHGPKTVQN